MNSTLKSPPNNNLLRIIVLEILLKLDNNKLNRTVGLSTLIDESIAAHKLSEREHRLVNRLVKTILENRSFIDKLIDSLVVKGIKSLEDSVLAILRIAAAQIIWFDNIADELIVNESVELAKIRVPRAAKFINGVLRSFVRSRNAFKAEAELNFHEVEYKINSSRKSQEEIVNLISSKFSHPYWLVDRWVKQWGEESTEAICKANQEVPPIYLQVNTSLIDCKKLYKLLISHDVDISILEDFPNTLKLNKLLKNITIAELPGFAEGFFYIQDLSSQIITTLINLCSNHIFLDLCAAPGGKLISTALGSLFDGKPQNNIFGADINQSRLKSVEKNLLRLKLNNIKLFTVDATKVKISDLVCDQPNTILLDVPCSGTGVINRKSDIRWQREPIDFKRLESLQGEILNNSSKLLPIGGKIIYSTCSLEISENEDQIASFLKENDNWEVVPIPSNLKKYASPQNLGIRIWPHKHACSGAYGVALLKVS
jgi:16S rRNA (cytosine967-C5)-methyltransferase